LTAIYIEIGEEVSCVIKACRTGDPPIDVADPTKAEQQLRFKRRRSDLQKIIGSAWTGSECASTRRRLQ
jgi:UDP-glucose 4-epimerase/UDP-arabinose 4-epimerase